MKDNENRLITYDRSAKDGHSFKNRLSAYMQIMKQKGKV